MNNKAVLKFLVFLMLPLAGSGIDIYSPSLPHIQLLFNTKASYVKYTISFYLFGLCLGQLILGTLSDYWGRRRVCLSAIIGFIIFTLLATSARSMIELILFRTMQGFVVGAIAANARSLITDTFDKSEIAKISPAMSLAWSLGPILAPLLGGVFENYFTWKMSLYFLALYSILILFLMYNLRETNLNRSKFNWSQFRLNFTLIIANKEYIQALLLMSISYSILIFYATVLPFFVQELFNKSAIFYGSTTTFIGLSYFLGAVLNRKLINKITQEKIINFSIAMMAVLTFMLTFYVLIFNPNLFFIYMIISLLTVFIACMFPACLSKCISLFPEKAGMASAIAGSGFIFIGSISSAIIGYINVKSPISIALSLTVIVISCVFIRLAFSRLNLSAVVES